SYRLAKLVVRQVCRTACRRIGRDISRSDRPERRAASEVVRRVDAFRLAHERIPSCRVGRIRMTVVAAAGGVHKITSESDEYEILAAQIEMNRSDPKSL